VSRLDIDGNCARIHAPRLGRREGVIDGFTKRYALKRLVHYEFHEDIRSALQREKNLKHWPRLWKLALVQESNPEWADLYEALNS